MELCKLLVSNDCRPHLPNMVGGGRGIGGQATPTKHGRRGEGDRGTGHTYQTWWEGGGERRRGDCVVYMLMRDAEGRDKEASKVIQTKQSNKHTQGSHFSKVKNELHVPRVRFEPMTLRTLDRAL